MDAFQKSATARIARNTLFLYGRMLLGMFVSLYTSRLVLNALGVEDFGIYGVVGGLVSMMSLFSSSLSASISRFMTYELGRGDFSKLKMVFATSVLIQIAICCVVLLIGESVGLWFMNVKMVIPSERIVAANWIYQASIVTFIVGLIGCPFNAVIVAHEKMDVYAYLGIADVFVRLAIAIFIAYSPLVFDRLIVYSVLLMFVSVGIQCCYWFYCFVHFQETRTSLRFDRQCWKEMAGFAGWNTIGCAAGVLKDQGVNVLLNLFFGPVVNTARAISTQVSGAIGVFSGNFMTALNPQIIKGYASGDIGYAFYLVSQGARFGFYIMMVLVIPIYIVTPFILDLWLGKYPDNTIVFLRLTLISCLIDVLSSTLITLQVATGRIRNYQIVVGGLLLLNFPLSYIVLKSGFSPFSVYVVAVMVGVCCLVARLMFLRSMVGFSVVTYFRKVLVNVFVTVIVASMPVALASIVWTPDTFFKLSLIAVVSCVSSVLSILFVGCNKSERRFIFDKIRTVRAKFSRISA